MIQILAVDFIRRNTELMKILKGMYDNHITIIKESTKLEKRNEELEEEIDKLNKEIIKLRNLL